MRIILYSAKKLKVKIKLKQNFNFNYKTKKHFEKQKTILKLDTFSLKFSPVI